MRQGSRPQWGFSDNTANEQACGSEPSIHLPYPSFLALCLLRAHPRWHGGTLARAHQLCLLTCALWVVHLISKLDLREGWSFSFTIFKSDIELSVYHISCFYISLSVRRFVEWLARLKAIN